MQEKSRLMTREQYLEMLVEASCWEASAMESGFMSWCERHVPAWRRLGQDETWIRQRIETAQITRGLHRALKEQGLTVLEIREELRRAYAASPELYDLARASTPERLRYRGGYRRPPPALHAARPDLRDGEADLRGVPPLARPTDDRPRQCVP